MPFYFWRVRSLEKALKRQPGMLKAHRWMSRRSLLLMSWWADRAAAAAWLARPEYERMARRASEREDVSLWVELYEMAPGGIHIGARGAPEP